MDMSTTFMGLELPHPFVSGASPLADDLDTVRKLEDAGYIDCSKGFDGRFPRTEYRLTAKGRRALERYLDHMEALIRATRER